MCAIVYMRIFHALDISDHKKLDILCYGDTRAILERQTCNALSVHQALLSRVTYSAQ